MKLALITDPRGFSVIDTMQLSYHLVLAQYVRSDDRYAQFYKARAMKGDFVIMDNGAAEEGVLQLHELKTAALEVMPDEIVLPDVLGDKDATIAMTMSPDVLNFVPTKRRAVVPQGSDGAEWLTCANYFVENLEFATLCVPKHAERFPGGRSHILNIIQRMGWHRSYHIHLLGVWDNPYPELKALRLAAPWARGLDTALPFALAQHGLELDQSDVGHVSHAWNKKFDKTLALQNTSTLMSLIAGYQ